MSDEVESIDVRVSNEESTSASADASIVVAYQAADGVLETRISNEEIARANGDSALETSLNSEISSRV